ncbi:hypothetical protein ABPG72_007315 [Tetrahymena utriculariae]
MNLNCSECNTLQQGYLAQISGIKISNINSILFKQSNASLFELICQSESKIYTYDTTLNGVLSQTPLISIQNTNYLEIKYSKFKNNECDSDGCVFNIKNIEILIIQDSTFISKISNQGKGGSIYLSEVQDTTIINSTFINNKSLKDFGGALYKTGQNGKILLKLSDYTVFQYNQAVKRKGGAIYLSKVNLKIEKSYIIQNEAAVGGGIYYDTLIPDLLKNYDYPQTLFIKQNKAKFYGNNVGSQLRAIRIDQNQIERVKLNLNKENSLAIYDFKSGGYLSLENVRLIDEEGNYVQHFQLSNLDINKNLQQEIENLNLQILPGEDIIVQGSTIANYQEKGFNFNFSITSQPMYKSQFQIQSNIQLDLLSSNKSRIQKQISFLFDISFRECVIGEINVNFVNKTICEEYPDGKYSLDQKYQICKICPNGAQKCLGSSIILFPGYWRVNNDTDEIISCSKNQLSCQPQKKTSKQSERVLLGYYLKMLGFVHLSNTVYNFQQLIFSQTLEDHVQVISVLDKHNLELPHILSFRTSTIGNPLKISNSYLDSIYPFKYINGIEYWQLNYLKLLVAEKQVPSNMPLKIQIQNAMILINI